MRSRLRISSLVPIGFAVESVNDSSDSIILTVRSADVAAKCRLCCSASRRIHLPLNPHPVAIRVSADVALGPNSGSPAGRVFRLFHHGGLAAPS